MTLDIVSKGIPFLHMAIVVVMVLTGVPRIFSYSALIWWSCAWLSIPLTEEGVYFDTVSGLDYLEGQTIKVLDEGADCGNYVVENGEVTLNTLVNDIWIGLPYDAYMETLERDYQDKQISTKMSKLRVYKLKLYIERTLGMQVQRLENGTVTTLITFDPSKKTDETPALLTGKYAIEVPSAWDCDYRLKIISDPGMPCIVSGIIIGVEINEL